MSVVKLPYQQALIIYREWYLKDLRVDFLLEDELNYELEIREIEITDDPNCTRRNRILRDRLRCERDPTQQSVYILKRRVFDEISVCPAKGTELFAILNKNEKNLVPKCKARLLHLANRIQILLGYLNEVPYLTKKFRRLFIDIVNAVAHFYKIPEIPLSIGYEECSQMSSVDEQVIGGEDEHGGEGFENQKDGTIPTAPALQHVDSHLLHPDVQIWIKSLQDRISDLELQLAGHNNSATQTTKECASQTIHVSPHCFTSHLPKPMPYSDSFDQYRNRQTSLLSHFNIPNVGGFTSNDVNNPIVGENGSSSRVSQVGGNCSHCCDNPRRSSSISGMRRYNDSSSNPVEPYNFPSHKSLPVSKWSLTKYDGEDQGLKLNEFLEYVHALSVAEHVGETELFESAVHLFKGPALNWYMTMRTTGRLLNWQHLVFELRRTFMHPDLDALIKMKIYQRRQQKNESFNEFYYEMERLFRTMSVQIPEFEKVQILQQNMRLDYKKQLNFLPIVDLQTLVAAGQKVDALNFSAYHKVFGSEKSVHFLDEESLEEKPSQKGSKNKNKSLSQEYQQSSSHTVTNAHSPSSSNGSQNRQHNAQSGSSQKSVTTLEILIDKHRPPPPNSCFNCGKFGHRITSCPVPRGVLCENCGFRGYPSNNCPFCTKNGLSATENRRSLNNSA